MIDIIIGFALFVLVLLAGHVLIKSASTHEQGMKRWVSYVSATVLMSLAALFVAQRFLGLTSTVI